MISCVVLLAVVAQVASLSLPGFFDGFKVSKLAPNRTEVRSVARTAVRHIDEWRARLTRNRQVVSSTRYGEAASRKLHPDDYFKFVPTPLGPVRSGAPAIHFTGSAAPNMCFQEWTVSMVMHESDKSADVHIQFDKKRTTLCNDLILLAAVEMWHIHDFIMGGSETIHLTGLSDYAWQDLKANGLRMLHFPDSVLGDLVDVYETAMLFLGGMLDPPFENPTVPLSTELRNVQFLKDHQGNVMKRRPINDIGYNLSLIQTGDFLGIIRLDGLDPMVAWGMGAHTGHTTSALMIDGEMHIVESQTKTPYWPKYHIQKHKIDEWFKLAKDASYNVVHLPLTKAARAKWNNDAAVKFFKEMEGIPYGYPAFLMGWIDSAEGNYPPPLKGPTVMMLWAAIQELSPSTAELMWNQALNRRLSTDGLNCYQAYQAADRRGISFGQLLSMPELDSYRYHQPAGHGWTNASRLVPAQVCNVFVCNLIRAGGILEHGDQINCGETTNWDVYSMDVYDGHPDRPEVCKKADPENPLCQIIGDFSLTLNGAGTVAPYPHMRERCAGIAPNYYWHNNTC